MDKELLLRPPTTEDALPQGDAGVASSPAAEVFRPAPASPAAVAVTPEPPPTPKASFSVAPSAPAAVVPEPAPTPAIAPLKNDAPAVFGNAPMVQLPSRKQQSWGALISIFIIVCMIIIGAFYAWGERIAEREQYYPQIAE